MEKRDGRRRLFKTFTACLLAVATLLSNVGAMEVQAAGIEAPTINKVFYDATSISGGNVHRGKIDGKQARGTIHVTLKDKDGRVKATDSVTPKSGTTWSVKLPKGVTIAEGDTVTAYQVFDGKQSPDATANAQPSKASTVTLTMPSGEIWIEQTSSNLVNEDEQAEAVAMFNNANTAIAGDIKSVVFSINTADHAYYEVTYTDDSTSGKVEAPNLTIKQVTEYSRGATLGSITIVDNVIKGQLSGKGPFDGIKVQILLKLSDAVKGSYCDKGKCLTDKDTSNPVDATVDGTTGEFTYTIQNPDLKLDQVVGVTVKEKNKFKSCSSTTVKPVTVGKTEVKDPRKLTAEDKKAIDAAIRKAYTVNGVSKLPDGYPGTDYEGIPAVIQIDDSGNVKIFSATDVEVTYDSNYNVIPVKNDDGSYKVREGAQPKITIQGKDLLKNIKPDAPTLALSEDKKNITITPNEKDTDAKIITVSYKDKDGKDQKIVATKADDGTWSITEGEGTVDANGVVSLEVSKVKGGTKVTATVTDKGGIAVDDKEALTSDPGTLPVEETKADKVKALGGLDPVVMKKWVGDKLDWKDGVKAKDSLTEENKAKIKAFLDEEGTKFTDVTTPGRNTDTQGDYPGTIKVTFDDGSSIEVKDQKLYVSDPVSPSDKENLPEDAIDVELKLGEGVKAGDKEGNKETPVTAKTYKVKPETDLSKEKVSKTDKTCFGDVGATVSDDTYVDVKWNDKDKGTNFKATADNNVFTATATKKFKVTVQANGGKGDDKVEYKKSGENFTLPAKDTFTPPNDNQEFSGWKIGDDTNLKQPNESITITGDTEIKAIWKPIEFKVDFKAGEGASGSMEDQTVTKGSEYELPTPTFTAPKDKVFAGWKVGDQEGVKQAKERITITGNVTLTATWKDNTVDITFDGAGGGGSMKKVSVTKGSEYTLPDNGFTAPKNQEFAGWEINGEAKNVGDKITVNGNTEVKAVWKPIMVDVIFDKGEGSGEKAKATVAKGSEYTLPNSDGFTPPENKEFAGWKVGDGSEVQAVGTKIRVNEDTKLTAVYKDQKVDITFNRGEGTGDMTKETVTKGSQYELPKPTFTPPADKEFAGWKVGNGNELKQPGTQIKVDGDTQLTAVYNPIQPIDPPVVSVDTKTGNMMITPPTPPAGQELKSLTVTYKDPAGVKKTAVAEKSADGWRLVPSATNGETVNNDTGVITIPKGKYKLEEAVKAHVNNKANRQSTEADATPVEVSFDMDGGKQNIDSSILVQGGSFALPAIYDAQYFPLGKEFAGWQVGNETKKVGDKITVNENTIVKALWKDKGTPGTPDPQDPANPEKPAEQPKNHYYKASTLIIPNRTPEPVEPAKEMEIGRHIRYLYGYEDRTVRPQGKITRAEAAALIARLAELDMSDKSKPDFADTPSAWYNSAINIMVKKDLMFGDKNGNFRPSEPITRGEFARALLYIDTRNDKVAPFADVKGHQFEAAINQAFGNGRINGYPDGTFRPDDYIQRAEAARMLNQYANRGTTLEGMAPVAKDLARFTDIDESHWAYCEIMEAANSHEYQRVKGTQAETWLKILYDDMKK